MYRIEWRDRNTGDKKHLKLHTIKAARITLDTLQADRRFCEVTLTRVQPTRVRELVIVFQP